MYENCYTSNTDDEIQIADTSHIEEYPVQKRKDIAGLVERHLRANPGLVLKPFGPGVRQENKALRNYLVRSCGLVVKNGKGGLCGVTAVGNRMALFPGQDIVTAVKKAWEQLSIWIQEPADLADRVQDLRVSVPDGDVPELQLQNVQKDHTKDFHIDLFVWLLKADGVWVVRLGQ